MSQDFLVEIGTEELPPKALQRLSTAFEQNVLAALDKLELGYANAHAFAAPRRLAIVIRELAEQTPDKDIQRRGPALKAAFDEDGCPSKAALGFARSCGVAVEDLDKLETEQGSWLVYRQHQTGQPTAELLADVVREALEALPIPRRMRWADLDAQFVRPVHWAILLFGKDVVETQILSVTTGRQTRGHRFHHPEALSIPTPGDYEVLLETEGKVIADFDRRRQTVMAQVEKAALELGGTAVIDPQLLDEVTAMVEWPMAVAGNFEARFLAVPTEALISTMSANQKYFHVMDDKGDMLPHFITVSNIESRDVDQVRHGNERVIRPRFADAEFFLNQDKKRRLDSRLDELKAVVFQKQLGSLYDKTRRIARLATTIAEQTGGDSQLAYRAAELCKCDLLTEMVGEFPGLQGIMGRYYAQHDGEDPEVAQAIDDHYKPRFSGDALPESHTAQAVALADRLDTLVGIFAIGKIPTGDKDPYALRRAALGVLRILIERNLDLDLRELLNQAAAAHADSVKAAAAVEAVLDFILDRLRAYYQDQGIRADVLDAVTALKPSRPVDIDRRIHAVSAFRDLPEAESLAAANKRIGNILKKVEGTLPDTIDETRFASDAEKTLYTTLTDLIGRVEPLLAKGDYARTLQQLAGLREPVDTFFDEVMVMAEEPELRRNRIALLNRLHGMFMQVADISRLQG